MQPVLEDLFIGPGASPSFSQGFRWEDSRRRVRVVFADMTVAESKRVMLFHEFGRLPVFYFPMEDVRLDLLEPSKTTTRCPYKGKATYWSAKIGERVFKNIVWSYREPLPACSPIANFLCFFNERVDAIYVDEELQPVPQTIWSE
jgi:uncharacterized protein (DUF427 family)